MSEGDLWFLRVRLPSEARIEYRLAIQRDGREVEIDDPLNPPDAPNPFGVNSVAWGPGYRRPEWSLPDPAVLAGRMLEVRVRSTVYASRRHYDLYVPAGHDTGGLPLLVVHDGSDYRRFAGLLTVLDNLIASGSVRPLTALLIDPANRLNEYAAHPGHAHHVVEEVLPHIRRRYQVGVSPAEICLMGASLGAVAALSTVWHYPETVGSVILQSGSFFHRPDGSRGSDVLAPVWNFLRDFEAEPHLEGVATYISAGRYEGVIDANRRLAQRIRASAPRVRYKETWDGHHWGSWRDRLSEALTWLLPGLPGKGPS
jgi:enterochelin esterase family protein